MKTRHPFTTIATLILLCAFLSTAPAQEGEAPQPGTEYWDTGQVRVRTLFYPDGELKEKVYYRQSGVIQRDERYDAAGRKVEESHYDGGGKLAETIDGWAAMRYTYEGGVLRVQTSFGADGRVIERKFYNAAGELVRKQYVGDNNIDPYEEFNPVPALGTEEIQYFDEDGVPEGGTSVTIE